MTNRYNITYNKELKDFVTPKHLKETPIHNWLVFPHSYSHGLISILKERWHLGSGDVVLDPFCGAGTTLLAAKKYGISAKGYDILPFSIFISNVKARNYEEPVLRDCWKEIRRKAKKSVKSGKKIKNYPELVLKALPRQVLSNFESLEAIIAQCTNSSRERDFFRLGLFAVMPFFSSAQATGGWLKWGAPRKPHSELLACYQGQVEMMLAQVSCEQDTNPENAAYEGDVRFLPDDDERYSAIITSPPYPNRHDYTRVFGVELMYGFLNWDETRDVRYQSLHSHPESKPTRPDYSSYVRPEQLVDAISEIRKVSNNNRIISMLDGYFIDIFCSLREMYRVCKQKANVALVVGNAQYNGIQFLVDEIISEIGEQLGFRCQEILTARLRGNSAQQMKVYGKKPSRESIIFFEK